MTKPRGDIIVRRFLAGDSVEVLAIMCMAYGMSSRDAMDHIESCIRRALNRKRRPAPRSKQSGRGTRLRFR